MTRLRTSGVVSSTAKMTCKIYLCICTFLLLGPEIKAQQQRQVLIPPLITSGPPMEMTFRSGESIQMTCVASGEPQPTYTWEMNDQHFDPSGNDGRIVIQPGVGTLIFANPIERDEGIYQCFAENAAGTALTVRVNLREAFLESFVNIGVRAHTPILGHPLTLSCVPPRSFPPPDVLWATLGTGTGFIPIQLTHRVTLDPIGNLHFANVQSEDWHSGRTYACIVQNMAMRSIQHGEYATVTPTGQAPQFRGPAILWTSPTHQVALRGHDWRVKCIFSGNPTPRVDWARLQGGILPLRARIESFGQDLVIRNIQYEDVGTYECQGINDEAINPIRRSFQLNVQSEPHWTNQPQSVSSTEDGVAVFHCDADGIPTPAFSWFVNGVPLSQLDADPRRVATRNQMTFYNVTKDDSQVLQCNATNNHGYIWENAFLNVLSEPPIILTPPDIEQRGAEGTTIHLRCEAFGSPVPTVVWRRGTEQLTGGRFIVLPSGDLEIEDLMMLDSSVYTCTATNKYDTVSATGSLIVRRRTRIERKPLDVFVEERTEAKITCTGSTDKYEMQNYRVDWMRDGTFIDYTIAHRMVQNTRDNSLTISGTITLDTGQYTCVVSNGLDSDSASASLIVMGAPGPPHSVWVLCTNDVKQAEITWTPGLENDAPILNFIVQFNTTFAPDTWHTIDQHISQNERSLRVTLSPWGNYTFRVLARNKIGISKPSQHTLEACRTEANVPDRNPDNVVGEGDMPDNLVIFWTSMPSIEQNGQDFRYILSWRRMDDPGAVTQTAVINRANAWHYVVPERQDTYKPFEIRVQAANTRGDSTVEPEMVIGYSGEDTPQVVPQNVEVDDDYLEATSVVLKWPQVDTDPDTIRGFFRGYRVQFAPLNDWPQEMRDQDFFLRDYGIFPRPRMKRDLEDEVVVTVMNLPPNTDIQVQVRVLNRYYAGPTSSSVNFRTKEGVPGPPASFQVRIRGATHLELLWEPPEQTNGELIGYNISYQVLTGLSMGRLQYRLAEVDAGATRARLTGLLPCTRYRVFLKAVTKPGPGEPIFLDMITADAGAPNPPMFWFTGVNDTWMNVSWQADHGNPGSVFYVQYRPRGFTEWWRTPADDLDMYMEIPNLDSGTTYQVRVTAQNGEGFESPSEWQEVRTSGIAPGYFDLATAMWFYGIWISLILGVTFLVLFIVLKVKHTDQQWKMREQEIEEQIRQLQAEEVARQMGMFNEYGDKAMDYEDDGVDASYEDDFNGEKPPHNGSFEKEKGQIQDGYMAGEKGNDYNQEAPGQSYANGYDPTNDGYDGTREGYDQSYGQYDQGYDRNEQGYDQDYDHYDPQYNAPHQGGQNGNVYTDEPSGGAFQPSVRVSGGRQADTFI